MPFDDGEYQRIREAMTRAIQRICPFWLRDQCEDLVQTSLLRLVELENRSEEEREFSASYLWQVAYSSLIDEIRKRKKRQEVSWDENEPHTPPTRRPNPEQKTAGREMGRAILDCIARLIDTRRRAIILALRGESARRIAELMGWNRRRAENLTLRGRKDLRRCLEAKGWKL